MFIRRGPKRPPIVAKVRRTKTATYGTRSEWSIVSAACLARDCNRCTKCGAGSTPGNHLNAHHIVSAQMGGRTVLTNLKTLCERCHSKMPHHGHLR